MAAIAEALVSYVPAPIARRFAADPTAPATPELRAASGAVLFADIVGFTPLARRLARRGPAGAEALSRILNRYFDRLISLIDAHGGEPVKFAGDGLLALWPAADGDLAVAAARAARCALVLQAELHDHEGGDDARLSLHTGIGAGDVLEFHVGGLDGRWYFFIGGAPLDQIGATARHAAAGEVLLSRQAWALVAERSTGEGRAEGCVRLDTIGAEPSLPSVPLSPRRDLPERAIEMYLPDPVRARLAGVQGEWLAELRGVTVLFLNLLDLDHRSAAALDSVQAMMTAVQPVLRRYDGFVNQLIVDDKGATLVAIFGAPPLAHEDDPVRAVRAAEALRRALGTIKQRNAIGITTGQAFCGPVGNDLRCEYTVVGDVINMAAQLMLSAGDDILCDEPTMHAARGRLRFDPQPAVLVKGEATPLPVYRPRGEHPALRVSRAMVNREAERASLVECLDALARGESRVIPIEGEAGMGKSRLVDEVIQQAAARGVTYLIGEGDPIEQATPYHAWRAVFSGLFGLDDATDEDAAARRARIMGRLDDPELARLAPLLNPILSTDFPETDLTAELTGELRASRTSELLVRLLRRAAGDEGGPTRPLLLVLDDAHWLDSASWSLAGAVAAGVRPLLLVLATRPLGEPVPAEYARLRGHADARWLRLDGLPPEETLALVRGRLGVATLPDTVTALIRERAEGNPFFSEELALALRDAGLIAVEDGVCQVTPEAGDLHSLAFPRTVEGVITSRIDRLTPAQQLTLKVASVIGRVFPLRAVEEVHPIEAAKPDLAADLEALARLDLILLDSSEPEPTYVFKHAITQDVTYSLLLFSQRRQLHIAVARWYEQQYAEDLSPYYALLSHHWGKAEQTDETLKYLELAGEQAAAGYANREAARFFSDALALAEESGVADRGRQARWECSLGLARMHMHDPREYDGARDALRRGLALLGAAIPGSRSQLLLGTAREGIWQVLHRLTPRRVFSWRSSARRSHFARLAPVEQRLEAAMAGVQPDRNDHLAIMYVMLRALNHVEAAAETNLLAEFYSDAATRIADHGLRWFSPLYARLAQRMLALSTDLDSQTRALSYLSRYYGRIGDWGSYRRSLIEAMEIAKQLGDDRTWLNQLYGMALSYLCIGDYSQATEQFAEVIERSRGLGQVREETGARASAAVVALRLGQPDSALALLGGIPPGDRSPLTPYVPAVYALAYLHHDDPERAWQTAERALAAPPPVPASLFEWYACLTETLLELWERSAGSEQKRQSVADAAGRACKQLRLTTQAMPTALPRALTHEGRCAWLRGQSKRAHQLWRRALVVARRQGMPYDEGLALLEIGRHLPDGAGERSHYLKAAKQIFEELSLDYRHAMIQDVLIRSTEEIPSDG